LPRAPAARPATGPGNALAAALVMAPVAASVALVAMALPMGTASIPGSGMALAMAPPRPLVKLPVKPPVKPLVRFEVSPEVSPDLTVRSHSSESSGFKSRPRSCPYTLVVRGSGVAVTRGREFSNDKAAGRNANEPMSSLVNEMELPTLWSKGEGRCVRVETTEVTRTGSRGSRVGMLSNGFIAQCWRPVQRGGAGHQLVRIRRRKRSSSVRESEGLIVPFEAEGQHNPSRGKGPCFVRATEGRRIRGLPCC
jgi:hypothetical protein